MSTSILHKIWQAAWDRQYGGVRPKTICITDAEFEALVKEVDDSAWSPSGKTHKHRPVANSQNPLQVDGVAVFSPSYNGVMEVL